MNSRGGFEGWHFICEFNQRGNAAYPRKYSQMTGGTHWYALQSGSERRRNQILVL